MSSESGKFGFVSKYQSLAEIMLDRRLASLGDAFVNFIHSLALSVKNNHPLGAKVKGRVLAEALRKTGLRTKLPSRTDRHKLANAAEALIIYGWLCDHVSLEESLIILQKNEDVVDGLSQLLHTVAKRTSF